MPERRPGAEQHPEPNGVQQYLPQVSTEDSAYPMQSRKVHPRQGIVQTTHAFRTRRPVRNHHRALEVRAARGLLVLPGPNPGP